MILAGATQAILDSPVIAVLLSGIGVGIAATLTGIFRLLSRFQAISQRVTDMDKVMNDMRQDLDVIKWGAVAAYNIHRGQYPPPTQE